MFKRGDRIVTAMPHPAFEEDASGIIVFAVDVGYGEWVALVYEGMREHGGKQMPQVVMEWLSPVYHDVVEHGCPVPELDEKFLVAWRSALKKAAADADRKHAHYPSLAKQVMANFPPITPPIETLRECEIDGLTDEDIRRGLALLSVTALRELAATDERSVAHLPMLWWAAQPMRDDLLAKMRAARKAGVS